MNYAIYLAKQHKIRKDVFLCDETEICNFFLSLTALKDV